MEQKRLLTSIAILNQELSGTGIDPISNYEDLEYETLNQLHTVKLDEYMEYMDKADERKEEEIFASYKALTNISGLCPFLKDMDEEKFNKIWDGVFSVPETKVWEECLNRSVIFQRLQRMKESDEKKQNIASLLSELYQVDRKTRAEIFGTQFCPFYFNGRYTEIPIQQFLSGFGESNKQNREKSELEREEDELMEILEDALEDFDEKEGRVEKHIELNNDTLKKFSHEVLKKADINEKHREGFSNLVDEFFKPKGEMNTNKIFNGVLDLLRDPVHDKENAKNDPPSKQKEVEKEEEESVS